MNPSADTDRRTVPDGPLHAADWYRVAGLRLRLRPGVAVSRQMARGAAWHVLTDPATGRHHRFNEPAYRLVAALDGELSLDEVWRRQLEDLGDDAPTQAETIAVVAQAYQAKLLLGPMTAQARAVVKAQRRGQRQRSRAAANPLAFRVRLWDPSGFLERHLSLVAPALTDGARRAAWVLAALALVVAAMHAQDLAQDVQAQLAVPRMLLLMWLAWPALKLVHELAHAFTVARHGGEVHELGVTLMVLTPVPYVDASASTAFADKRQRVAVAAAGILAEATLASLGLLGWLAFEPGLLRQACLAVMLVGGVSTLLVNGNPLMRYDGYHVLADAFELPNLASRSLRWWQGLAQRRLLGRPGGGLADVAKGETPWLMAYAPLSWAWRVALLAVLSLSLATYSQLLAVGLLVMAAWLAVCRPLWASLRWVWQSTDAAGQRVRAAAWMTGAAAAAVLLLFAVPVTDRTQAPGVVWLPDEAFVRLRSDARVEAYLVDDGATVAVGTPLVRLANEELMADLARARGQWRNAQIERLQKLEADAARAAVVEDEIRRLAAEVQRLQELADSLVLRAGVAGRVVVNEPQRWVGRWLPQGEVVAQVLPPGPARVRALVRNEDIARIREQTAAVGIQLAHADGAALAATVEGGVPQASRTLPTAALGTRAGGPVAVDPGDGSGRTALEPRFAVDLRLPAGTDARVGARALVTFEHGSTTAGRTLGRLWRQTFLRHFAT